MERRPPAELIGAGRSGKPEVASDLPPARRTSMTNPAQPRRGPTTVQEDAEAKTGVVEEIAARARGGPGA
jgi:hypothetical protein